MKQYRLLRDNKETGPYAAEDLIRLGLKKYDLLWAEGKSAAWRYPCEFDELKPYAPAVEEQPFDRFYKKPQQKTIAAMANSVNSVPAITENVKKEKPRIKIKADWNKIETSYIPAPAIIEKPAIAEKVPIKETVKTINNTPAWENMWLDWEQEKKAVSHAADRDSNLEIPQVKFSQSLDDIKQRYVETVLNKEKSKGFFDKYKNQLTAAALLIAILAAGMWVGLKWSDKTGYAGAIKNPQQNIQLLPGSEAADPQQNINNDNTDSKTLENPEQTNSVNAVAPQQNNIVAASNRAPQQNYAQQKARIITPATKSSIANQNPPPQIIAENNSYQPSATDANGVRTAVKRADVINTGDNATAPPQQNNTTNNEEAAKKSAPTVDDFVNVESYPVPDGVQYEISNISDVPLDLITIDLQYYDAAGKYLKGETLYIKNIGSGESKKVNAPANAKAAGIKYKVSMITAQKNDINIIAD